MDEEKELLEMLVDGYAQIMPHETHIILAMRRLLQKINEKSTNNYA